MFIRVHVLSVIIKGLLAQLMHTEHLKLGVFGGALALIVFIPLQDPSIVQ